MRIPPVFRRFRRVFSSSSEEKYHKSEKNHKKPMRYNGLSSAKRREKVYPRKSWSTKPHESGTKGLSTKQARKVHPRKVTNRTRKGLSAYLAPPSRVPLLLRFLYSLCTSIPSAPLFPLHLCSYSPPSTKGRQSGTKGMFDNECFLHLIN